MLLNTASELETMLVIAGAMNAPLFRLFVADHDLNYFPWYGTKEANCTEIVPVSEVFALCNSRNIFYSYW